MAANPPPNKSSFPRNWFKDPDTSEPELAEQRLRQWRQTSRNPFEPVTEESSNATNTVDTTGEPPDPKRMPSSYSTQTTGSAKEKSGSSKPKYRPLKFPGSKWVPLFYDLAWSSSFASLTEQGKFENPMDTVSYFLFFAAVWWLWASQTLYSIHFYTNDWFHLTSTFLQLFLFGMLSATTLGYDVTTYISHSPGIPTLRGPDDNDIDPQRYTDERTAYLSMLVLGIAIIHLVQYARALWYANWSVKEPLPANPQAGTDQSGSAAPAPDRNWILRIPPQLIVITIGLGISTSMFIAALGIAASDFGGKVPGASTRLGLWIGGFLIEVFSHLIMPFYWFIKKHSDNNTSETNNLVPHLHRNATPGNAFECELPVSPDIDMYDRLLTITTIVLGEGINGIAGTLSAVLIAPGVGRTVAVNVISAACIVWFIAYIYFEGPMGENAPRLASLRFMLWIIVHLPFLASTVLLLIGIKSQFLLTSFLSALYGTIRGFNDILNRELLGHSSATYWKTNRAMREFLIPRGIVWETEFDNLLNATTNATADEKPFVTSVWSLRLSLTLVLNVFKDINGGDDSIPSDIQPDIEAYSDNFAQVVEDLSNKDNPGATAYYKILTGLLDGYTLSTRYIVALAGLILISLSLQDFIHSWPRDRYQWGVVSSRFFMGVVLCFLLLLNLGKYQELFVPTENLNERAGVFLWLESFWVLPTIAIAYGLQFLIEIILARFAERATTRAQNNEPSQTMASPQQGALEAPEK